ncbi:SKI family transcriptional corepressor 1 homolog-B-like [Dreissena polymorpha]|nr:SKI family transcriptional corepressor 1 homolog-B-like [Dreissena polymorpha]
MEFDRSSTEELESERREPRGGKLGSTILKTPEQTSSYPYRQNTVSTVVLHGVPIVSLLIDGKERLCLAQISNTLLKSFSYNEIHNRRVALGITCVQCTPVQLEILRRAGAMPISSRRCGMITKREAERLVKSFLEDNRPPKLPDSFYFEVHHNCGWGCKGKFEPSRYNSSRAKCIRCNVCNLYFSPNKFIFHFHRTAESKYNHPDAANFNSWRRHLHLVPGTDTEDIFHAWEDVKAMFNGGSRKRTMSSPCFQEPHSPESPPEPKRAKITPDDNFLNASAYSSQYQSYPLFSFPPKGMPFNALPNSNPMSLHYPFNKADHGEEPKSSHPLTFNPWRQPNDFVIPPYDFFWASQFTHRSSSHLPGFRAEFGHSSPVKELTPSEHSLRHSSSEGHSSSEEEEPVYKTPEETHPSGKSRISAFRPVGKQARNQHEPDHKHLKDIHVRDDVNDSEDLEIDVEDGNDIEKTDFGDNLNKARDIKESECHHVRSSKEQSMQVLSPASAVTSPCGPKNNSPTVNITVIDTGSPKASEGDTISTNNNEIPDTKRATTNIKERRLYDSEELEGMTKEELQQTLEREMAVRRRVEGDIHRIRKSLEEQVHKEKNQRDEISSQLQVMKVALCNELEQERKIRLTMQQKLREAHEALHSFSGKMFNGRPCATASDILIGRP